MTVYPLRFTLGPLEITGYGLMMMVGFLMAGWVIQRQLAQRRLNEDYAADIVVAAVLGGILGAKLWYVALTQDLGALLSRGGLVWYGGFIGGWVAVIGISLAKKVPVRLTMDLCAPALAVGYALGRVGCFMVQDDYGGPTTLPWGMKFPQGLPASTAQNLNLQFGIPIPQGASNFDVLAVHPTQLYEVAAMLVVFALLWRLRHHRHGTGWLMGLYLTCAGIERFLIEFLRAKDDRVLAGFTLAQATSVAVLLAGLILLVLLGRREPVSIPPNAAVLNPRP
jgi:phosphatidylglycerol---prolipoprotein diacylglyceryl transferase